MAQFFLFDHPLIQHKVSLMRDKNTTSKEFRHLAREVAMLMAFEVTRDLPTMDVEIETPICKTTVKKLAGMDVAVVPILRAGLGFVDGMLEIIPNAKVGHVGLYRDPETKEPVEYYCKLPEDIDKRRVIIVDPMLATGGSAIAAVDFVKKTGVDALAVAIGTAHGKYPEGFVPKLDFERLAELKAALKMPLVLHGGSGSGEENIRKAVAGGINKINVCTDAFHAAEKAMKAKWEAEPNTDYLGICMVAEKAVKEFVRDYIRLIGSNNRYTFEAADNGSKE